MRLHPLPEVMIHDARGHAILPVILWRGDTQIVLLSDCERAALADDGLAFHHLEGYGLRAAVQHPAVIDRVRQNPAHPVLAPRSESVTILRRESLGDFQIAVSRVGESEDLAGDVGRLVVDQARGVARLRGALAAGARAMPFVAETKLLLSRPIREWLRLRDLDSIHEGVACVVPDRARVLFRLKALRVHHELVNWLVERHDTVVLILVHFDASDAESFEHVTHETRVTRDPVEGADHHDVERTRATLRPRDEPSRTLAGDAARLDLRDHKLFDDRPAETRRLRPCVPDLEIRRVFVPS